MPMHAECDIVKSIRLSIPLWYLYWNECTYRQTLYTVW